MTPIDETAVAAWLAHQGGWDEILLVAGPLAVFGGALMLANRRANTKLAERAAQADTAESSVAAEAALEAGTVDGASQTERSAGSAEV